MKRILLWLMVLVIIISMIAVFSFVGCKAPVEEAAPAEEEAAAAGETTAAETTKAATETTSGEPVKLVVWWWGEQEAPGLENWVKESVDLYQKENPNITIEVVLQTTEGLIPSFRAAAAAKEGPDIQYFWQGTFMMDDIMLGYLAPISDYVDQEEIDHWIRGDKELEYGGKIYAVPFYYSVSTLAYNKSIFKEAGLDPSNPPATWEDLLNACEKIKAVGYIPISAGGKDMFAANFLFSFFGCQYADSIADIMKPCVGEAKYTDPDYAEFWKKMIELKEKGYLNDDYNSLDFYQGQELFTSKKSAMTLNILSGAVGFIKALGDDLAVMTTMPKWGNGSKAGSIQMHLKSLGLTSWSKHPKEAVDFLKFLHSPDRLNTMYAASGAWPADNRVDFSSIKNEIEKAPSERVKNEELFIFGRCFIPNLVATEGLGQGMQSLFSGEKADVLAQKMVEIVEKWQLQDPELSKKYVEWYDSIK